MVLTTGQLHSSSIGRFTHAYVAHPSEITLLMETNGFMSLDLLACEGIVSGIDEQVNRLEGDAWDVWEDLSFQLVRDPSIHGSAYHLLYVGQSAYRPGYSSYKCSAIPHRTTELRASDQVGPLHRLGSSAFIREPG